MIWKVKINLDDDLDNDLLEEKLLLLLTKTAGNQEHRENSGDAVQNQGSGCDKYSVNESN